MNYSKRTWEKQIVIFLIPPPQQKLEEWPVEEKGGGGKKITKDLQVPPNMMLQFFGFKIDVLRHSGGGYIVLNIFYLYQTLAICRFG